jgi:hypothetical protein
VYSHDVTKSNDDGPDYDIDSTLDIIQAYGHSTRLLPGTSMSLSTQWWTQLSQDAKDIWDNLPDKAKGIILDRKRDPRRTPGRGPPRPPPFHSTNLHDTSAYDYILANRPLLHFCSPI